MSFSAFCTLFLVLSCPLSQTRASIVTIIRIPYIHEFNEKDDFLYATSDVAIYSMTETGLGIAASCFATLRPLFRDFLQLNLWGGNQTSRGHNSSRWPGTYDHAVRMSRGDVEDDLLINVKRKFGTSTTIGANRSLNPPNCGSRIVEESKVTPASPVSSSGQEMRWHASESLLRDDSRESKKQGHKWGVSTR